MAQMNSLDNDIMWGRRTDFKALWLVIVQCLDFGHQCKSKRKHYYNVMFNCSYFERLDFVILAKEF